MSPAYLGLVSKKGIEIFYLYLVLAGFYLTKKMEPNNDETEPFSLSIEVWKYGGEGTVPVNCVCKAVSPSHLSWIDCGTKETQCSDCSSAPAKATDFSGIVKLSFRCADGLILYKDGWDGTVPIVNGDGSIADIFVKSDDGSPITANNQRVLIEGELI